VRCGVEIQPRPGDLCLAGRFPRHTSVAWAVELNLPLFGEKAYPTHTIIIQDPLRLREIINFAEKTGCTDQLGRDLIDFLSVLCASGVGGINEDGKLKSAECRSDVKIFADLRHCRWVSPSPTRKGSASAAAGSMLAPVSRAAQDRPTRSISARSSETCHAIAGQFTPETTNTLWTSIQEGFLRSSEGGSSRSGRVRRCQTPAPWPCRLLPRPECRPTA
jgi:hypothetical protein